MKIYFSAVFLFLSCFTSGNICASSVENQKCLINILSGPDSLRDRQALYNGVLWKNPFRRMKGDQYLFSNIFLPGIVTYNEWTFVNIRLRYDIYSDEIMIPRSLEQIVQLNKEMVDSFSLVFENRIYKFINTADTYPDGPEGYVNVLYTGRSALFVKYRKKLFTEVTDESDGEFYQVYTIYFINEGKTYILTRLKDIYNILKENKSPIRKFVKENRLKVNKKVPDSFVPVIRYYDSISN